MKLKIYENEKHYIVKALSNFCPKENKTNGEVYLSFHLNNHWKYWNYFHIKTSYFLLKNLVTIVLIIILVSILSVIIFAIMFKIVWKKYNSMKF